MLLKQIEDIPVHTLLKVKAVLPAPGNGKVREHAAIVMRDDRIEDILSWEEADAAFPRARVDLRPQAWALPGFIDAHVHLSFSCGSNAYADMLAEMNSEALMMLRLVRNAQASLLAGVTTVRDCGAGSDGIFQLRNAIAAGSLQGSSIVASGRPFTVTGGHCWYLNREVEGEENVRRCARQTIKDGADFLKMMISGGNMTPNSGSGVLQYSPAEVQAFAQEARMRGKMTAVHVHSTDSIRSAVAAGVSTLEHCSFRGADGTIDYDAALVEVMARQGMLLSPAFSASYRTDIASFPEEKRDFWRVFRKERMDVTARMLQQGVPLALGTDAGCSLTEFSDYALCFGILKEQLGFSNAAVLESATATAARCCGLDKETGSLEKGKRADITLLAGNPLEDLEAARQVLAVYQYGRLTMEDGKIMPVQNKRGH